MSNKKKRSTIDSINSKLSILELLHSDFKELKASLEFSQSQIDSASTREHRNRKDQSKLFLTKKLTSLTRTNRLKATILDLQCRSVHDNLISSGIPEDPGNPEEALKELMETLLKPSKEEVKPNNFPPSSPPQP